jgi:hypothetical protein
MLQFIVSSCEYLVVAISSVFKTRRTEALLLKVECVQDFDRIGGHVNSILRLGARIRLSLEVSYVLHFGFFPTD